MSHESEFPLREKDAVERKRRRRSPDARDWTKEEDQVIDRFAVQMKTRCRFFQRLLDSTVAELERFHQRHPKCRPGALRRTRDGVRGRLYIRARALGRGLVAPRWEPEERRLSERWARKSQHGKGRPRGLCLRDCARMLLVDLYEKGHDRSLRSCCMEIRKQRQKMRSRSWAGRPGV